MAVVIHEKVFIYSLNCPYLGKVMYIGKANDIEKRFKSHIKDSRSRNTPVYKWIRDLSCKGKLPVIKKIIETTKDQWPCEEKRIIKKYGINNLLNVSHGGKEPYCDLETRRSNGAKVFKALYADEKRKRIAYMKREMNRYIRDGHASEERKERLRQLANKCPKYFACWADI